MTWMRSKHSRSNLRECPESLVGLGSWKWRYPNHRLKRLKYFIPSVNCRLLPNRQKAYEFCTPISKVHALLDQFKKFSGVVKQMGGVKELFKDEKQVKNLNPQKMGKVGNI